MTAPRWFFRFMYDRESAAWERRRDEPKHRELVERSADELANWCATARTQWPTRGCGPGAHSLALHGREHAIQTLQDFGYTKMIRFPSGTGSIPAWSGVTEIFDRAS